MYRSALRSSPRIANSLRQSAAVKAAGGRRFASTTPANKSRSWKSSALRWGIAVGAVYYYNTSNAFAEEPVCMRRPLLEMTISASCGCNVRTTNVYVNLQPRR